MTNSARAKASRKSKAKDQVNAKLGGRRAQIWLGNFATLTEMSDADLAHLVVAKIAQKEAKLLCNKEN